ncbi:DUF2690 domain-containing protein [Kitasatospora purpeofusca]|uniref:DUF2690 domain-containing protein n=1 Tax=Kitasatospora purpeofusca TaxID=67352 RepID=UPI0038640E75|nr:YjfA family protein [Kitasatospora purpeofusca]
MKRTNRTVGVLVGLAAVATALGGLAAPTASAAPPRVAAGCSGLSCFGLDPANTGCSADGYTVESVGSTKGTIELRYSPSCKANWARISGASAGQWFSVQDDNNWFQWWRTTGATGYGNMVDGSGRARACIDGGACTNWH